MNSPNLMELLRVHMAHNAREIGPHGLLRKFALLGIAFAMLTFALLCHGQSQSDEIQLQLGRASAQPSIDTTIEAVRAGMRSERNAMIIAGMDFSDKEGSAFWPLYRKYEFERSTLDDVRVLVIKEYADKYLNMTDADAKGMTDRMFECDAREIDLKKKYFKEFNKVLPAIMVAKFFQLEHRVDLLMGIKVESSLPPVNSPQNAENQN